MQAFIQALFSTALFPQRFSFFTVCLVQWHHGPWGGPMVDTNENVLKFRSADRCKMHFSWIFFLILEFHGGVLKKTWLEIYMQLSFMRVCRYYNLGVRRINSVYKTK